VKFINKFGRENVYTNIPITEPEVDVRIHGEPVSIKTVTGRGLNSVKLIWTVDVEQASKFGQSYTPSCDMVFVQIVWEGTGALYYFPLNVQIGILNEIGRNNYIKLPRAGTNPRGVEISAKALGLLTTRQNTLKIPVNWLRSRVDFDPYTRWIDLWGEG
jgi:hypothetical protein